MGVDQTRLDVDYSRNRGNQRTGHRDLLCVHISSEIPWLACGVGFSNPDWTHDLDCPIGTTGIEMVTATIVPIHHRGDSDHLPAGAPPTSG